MAQHTMRLLGQDEGEKCVALDSLVSVSTSDDLCLINCLANLRLFIFGERDVDSSHILIQVLDLLSASLLSAYLLVAQVYLKEILTQEWERYRPLAQATTPKSTAPM